MQEGAEQGWMRCPKELGKKFKYKHREGKTSAEGSLFYCEFKIAYKAT